MADKRIQARLFTSAVTMCATGSGLLYGAILSTNGGGGASLSVANHNSTGNVPLGSRLLVLESSAATGTVQSLFPFPVQSATGIFASLSSGTATILFSTRN